MNWQHFQTYNDAPTQAFESMCGQLFELWCNKEYANDVYSITIVNGSGGDGGVEAYATFKDSSIIGMQAKWFPNAINQNQFSQIKSSIETALKVRPNISKYIVCIPRNLAPVRIGSKGKLVADTEQSKWEKLRQAAEKDNPGLDIILWNEAKLHCLLQDSYAAGMHRYWFEKSEIDNEMLHFSLEKQKSGWLSQKYIPALHSEGIIANCVLEITGTDALRKELLSDLSVGESLCEKFIQECIACIMYDKELSNNQKLFNIIKQNELSANELLGEIKFAKRIVQEEIVNVNLLNIQKWHITCYELINELENTRSFLKDHAHKDSLKKAASKLYSYDTTRLLKSINKQINSHMLLVLGEPGTGKTHGISHQVEKLLGGNYHKAVLIRAKDYDPNCNWHEIIMRALGLSGQWNELEIWNALEALSYRSEVNSAHNGTKYGHIKAKILICIDGIDESMPYDAWLDRLCEAEAISKRYKRIKFCVTSRPYIFRECTYSDILFVKDALKLPYDGDVAVSKLYDDYINYYKIEDKDSPWIKWCLKTPLALRLFCENYHGQNVGRLHKSSITITNLLEQKIKRINAEFCSKYHPHFTNRDATIESALLLIADKFMENIVFSRDELMRELSSIPTLSSGAIDYRSHLLDYFEDYGLLQSRSYRRDGLLQPRMIKYSIGIQPFFDYLIALRAITSAGTPEKLQLTKGLKRYKGALQMASILLLEDYSFLILENHNISQELSNDTILDVVCFALSNVSAEVARKYIPLSQQIFNNNAESLRYAVNNLILPVSRIPGHPLGPVLLNQYLLSFESVAQRDIRWSIPAQLYGDELWEISYEIALIEYDQYRLEAEDSYDGLPLVYAWMLTSVDNTIRIACRKELMQWALINPIGFYKLFEKTIITNDPQMKEDLFAIVMGVVFSAEKDAPYLDWIKNWFSDNIFSSKEIEIYDASIRYYCHAIMERLFSYGLISDNLLEKSRPPYSTKDLLPIAKEAIAGTRMGGFGPIDYDLARYVLCDYIDGMFFTSFSYTKPNDSIDLTEFFSESEIEYLLNGDNIGLTKECRIELEKAIASHIEMGKLWRHFEVDFSNYTDKNDDSDLGVDEDEDEHGPVGSENIESPYCSASDNLLQEYASHIGVDSINYEQLLIALAYAYILKMGWNEDEFHGKPNGGSPGEVIGVDIAIMRDHYPATHGQKSSVMTFAEKYVWCARNEILGFLSDRLPFNNEGDVFLLKDYSLLDGFPNPAQEVYQVNEDELMKTMEWFTPEDLAPLPEDTTIENCLKKWIMEAPDTNFQNWICPDPNQHQLLQEGWITLYGYNSISNAINGETLMWISSGFINKQDFPRMLRDVYNGQNYLVQEFDNPVEFHSSTQTHCYLTPKELCWMNWKSEYGNPVKNITIENGDFVNYSFSKAVEECVGHYLDQGDVYYILPSRDIRKYLNITDGDGYSYYNSEKEIVASWFRTGEKWSDSQSYLFVDGNKLMPAFENKGLQLFWLIRIQRQATPKGMEAYPDATKQYNRCWLVWKENDIYKTIKYIEEV